MKTLTKAIAVFLCLFSWSASAQEDVSAAHANACPDSFFDLPLYPEANLCLVFDQELPASLTYHAKASQDITKDFYKQQLGPALSEEQLKGRIVLQYKGGEQTIIISPDGAGSQVDILVKS